MYNSFYSLLQRLALFTFVFTLTSFSCSVQAQKQIGQPKITNYYYQDYGAQPVNWWVLEGGSAGSLCWTNGGTTDSRPKELSIVKGMSFIDKSHCPHYNSEKSRRPLYHKNIMEGKLTDGYACDDRSAIHFINEKVEKSVSLDEQNHSYYVYLKDNIVVEEKLVSSIIT